MSYKIRGIAILIWILSGILYSLIENNVPQKNNLEKVDMPVIRDTTDGKSNQQEIDRSVLLASRS